MLLDHVIIRAHGASYFPSAWFPLFICRETWAIQLAAICSGFKSRIYRKQKKKLGASIFISRMKPRGAVLRGNAP